MRPPIPLPRWTLAATRWMAALVIGLTVATCRDNPVAPRGGGRAAFAIRPLIAQHVDLSGFGLTIDSLRVVVVHAPADTVRDTTAYFNPDSSQVHLSLSVLLSQPSETLSVSLSLLAAGVPLFTGTQSAVVSVGSSSTASPISITLHYTGPGAGVTALHITPLDSVLHFSDSLRFRVTADTAGTPVTTFYTSWHTSDTLAARINAFGILHAPALRKAVYVIVRTLSGAADSTPITFIPTPTLLAIQTGNGQTSTVGGLLPVGLQVRVTAADALGVKGIPVQFSVLSGGGSVAPTSVVVTDSLGYASATATLGTVAGAATYQAAASGLTAVTFTATVKPGLPTQLLANAGAGQTVVAGALVPIVPSVVAKDTFNNVVPGAIVTFSVGAGHLTQGTDTTNTSGVAAVGSWTLDTIARVDTLTATLGALTRVFTATGIAGAISAARSLITLAADSVLSGTAGTLTLHARDQYGNALTAGGATVAFTVSGGTSTGSVSGVTDHGDGTYTATFTGTVVGTVDTVHATIGAVPVTSPLPTLRVVPGAVSLAQSVLAAAGALDSSGLADSVILTAKDVNGNVLSSGGLTVVFSKSGGTSTGNLSPAVSLGGGKYGTVFTGVLAGTATTISATIGGLAVTSTLPTVQVVPGVASVATSAVSVTQGSIAVGAHSILTLQAKDAAGNSLTAGGLTVVFSLAGGTSTGSLAPATAHDNGNGTYTDTLTALVPGTATTVHATLGGTAVASTGLITVVLGNLITSQSLVTVDSATLASGDSTLVHLQAKDSAGINLGVGGLTVVFSDSGGTSTGAVGSTTDHLNGTYTAVLHGLLAGTPTTIHATINGVTVSSSLPTVAVTPGGASPATSVVTVPIDSVASGGSVLITIQLKDAAGNPLTTAGGASVVFSAAFGTSTGTIAPSPAAFAGAGTDTARFTGVLAGTRDTIKATINTAPVTTARPTLLVFPGPASPVTSTVTVADSVVAAGGIDTLTLTTRDAAGNLLGKGGLTVAFTTSGGTSTGSLGGTTDLGNGTYRAIFTGLNAGTAVTVGATIGGTPVTSALPTLRVNTTVHVSNILADSVWTTIASPHIVHGYLKIANGATLTIQPGAVVKFDTASGLQVGDTAVSQSGLLSLAGTAIQPITLTADSTAVRPGFWRGIEVQRLLGAATWTHVLLEGAGGARPLAVAQSCLLSANASGAALVTDSLHVRACLHNGIALLGGTLTVRRSEVDSAGEAGIQAMVSGSLTVDSTGMRGNGFQGLSIGPASFLGPFLAQAVHNKFIGNGTVSALVAVSINARDLPHFGLQDTIANNAKDVITVQGGSPDSTVSSFTLFRQFPAARYEVLGPLVVGSGSGQAMILDSNVVVTFVPQAGLIIGDSTGASAGLLKTLATGPGNGPLLTSANTSPAPGDWLGVEFSRLSGPDTVVGLHVQFGGDSVSGHTLHRAGIWVRNPNGNELVIQGAALAANGSASAISNSYGLLVTGSGGGVHVYGTVSTNTAGSAFAYSTPGVRLVGDTALASTLMGLADFVPSGTNLSPADSVAQSRFTGGLYPALVPVGVLPGFYGSNSWNGNIRDTLLMGGGAIVGQSVTFPRVHAVPWRFLGQVTVAGGGSIVFAAGDTVAFDTSAAIIVGDTLNGPGILSAIAPDTAPILFVATPGAGGHWHGITYLDTPGDTSLRNVTVDGAGYFQPCLIIDCNGQPIGAIHIVGTPLANLVFDSITVRNSLYYAVQTNQGGSPGAVVVRHGQFYRNAYPNVFFASHGGALTVDSSDIYAYRTAGGITIFNSNGTFDSVTATHNWWGDVAGPGLTAFGSADSLGRTPLDTAQTGVAYLPFATAPYFPVGAFAAVTPAADSNVFCCGVQAGQALPDSIRVRALDAFGRGVGGVTMTWTPAPGSGVVTAGSATDIGGRAGSFWTPTTVAKLDTATASSGGRSANMFVDVNPGFVTSEHWKYLPGLTQGNLLPSQDTAIFTASGRVGAVLTSAVDAFGNAVLPTSVRFDSLPAAGFDHGYGIVTKLAGDTIFFVDTSSIPVGFQLHGVYGLPAGQLDDSVVIFSSFVPVGVRVVPDTVVINSICPTGPGNLFCTRPITAQLFDSTGTALPPNGQILFGDSLLSGSAVTIDSTRGPSLMTTFVTARQPGTTTFAVTQLTGALLTPATATVTVIVQQVAGQIGVTPDTLATGMGDTVTFHAAAADSGGTLLVTQPGFQWEVDSIFRAGLVKLDSAADSLQVRLDSGVYNFGSFDFVSVTRPFVVRAPGDTVFGQGTLHNPLVYNVVGSGISIGTASRAAVDTVTNKTFYTSGGNQTVYVNDNTVNGIVAGVTVGFNPSWITVSHAGGADKVYVSNNTDGSVSVIDPATNLVSTTIVLPVFSSPYGIAAADPLGRVYVAARYCPGGPPFCVTQVAIMPIDVAGDSVVTGDIVALNTDSLRFPQGMAFNPNDHRLYVAMDSGYVKVVDPVAKAEVGTILVQPGFTLSDVAVNPVTDTVYVSNFAGGGIAVIDPTTSTVVNSLPANTPTGIGVDPRHNRIYYASSGNQSVIEIDGTTENFHTLLVGAGGDNPQDAQPDPRTGTVYAPHFTALTVLQFYGKPVGALLGAPPVRTLAPAATRLAPMARRPVAPQTGPAARPTPRQPARPAPRRPGNAVDNKKAPPK